MTPRYGMKKGTPYEAVRKSSVYCAACELDIAVGLAHSHFEAHRKARAKIRLQLAGYGQGPLL